MMGGTSRVDCVMAGDDDGNSIGCCEDVSLGGISKGVDGYTC